jgi:ArsR family metal-binding transcriptional regulator
MPCPVGPLIKSWDILLQSPDCKPGSDTRNAKVLLVEDISEVLPYLNATLPSAMLCSEGSALIWKNIERSYAFRAHEISMAPVQDNEDARNAAENIVSMVNDIWKRRNEIKAVFTYREPPKLLEIYKLLPKTNCKKCGRATCMAFAGDLREGKAAIEECLPVCEAAHEQAFRQLREITGQDSCKS